MVVETFANSLILSSISSQLLRDFEQIKICLLICISWTWRGYLDEKKWEAVVVKQSSKIRIDLFNISPLCISSRYFMKREIKYLLWFILMTLITFKCKINPTYHELNIDTIINDVRILKQWSRHDWFIITGLFELKQTVCVVKFLT